MGKQYSGIPGYIAERAAPDGGIVYVFNGIKGKHPDIKKYKPWVLKHSNGRSEVFQRQKEARHAMVEISQGRDSWGLLNAPETTVELTNVSATEIKKLGNSLQQVIDDTISIQAIVTELNEIALKATRFHKEGDELVEVKDNAARLNAIKLIFGYVDGTPIARTLNITRNEESVDDIMDKAKQNPEWARPLHRILSKILEQADE